jgi:hypothetical protein
VIVLRPLTAEREFLTQEPRELGPDENREGEIDRSELQCDRLHGVSVRSSIFATASWIFPGTASSTESSELSTSSIV